MDSLRRIESLPPSRRSSMVGQAGVLADLRMLEKGDAIEWLRKNIHSPVSRDWGNLLYSLSADWRVLKAWLHLSKEHALAAADAIDINVSSAEKLPAGCSPSELLSELQAIRILYPSPRLGKSIDAVTAFSGSVKLSSDIYDAAKLLFGPTEQIPTLTAANEASQWHSLLHKASNKYCVLVLDWKASKDEQRQELHSLPIFQNSDSIRSHGLVIETVETGSDEIVLIALPECDMQRLKQLVPKPFTFKSLALA